MQEREIITYSQAQKLATAECDDFDNKIPERKLLVAVLERAILDLNHTDRNIRKDSRDWFKEKGKYKIYITETVTEDTHTLYSFKYICRYLNLDHNHVRDLAFSRIGKLRRFRALRG